LIVGHSLIRSVGANAFRLDGTRVRIEAHNFGSQVVTSSRITRHRVA
jgi:hypothetical protein